MSACALVVEADRTAGELITAVLTRDGFRVTLSRDGSEAMEKLADEKPALLICARDLPGTGGEALCHKARELLPDTKVVLLYPGLLDDRTRQSVIDEIGCDSVQGRPFRYADLKRELVVWGLLEGTGDKSPSPAPGGATLSFDLPPVAPPDISELLPGGTPLPTAAAPPSPEASVAAMPASESTQAESAELDLDDLVSAPAQETVDSGQLSEKTAEPAAADGPALPELDLDDLVGAGAQEATAPEPVMEEMALQEIEAPALAAPALELDEAQEEEEDEEPGLPLPDNLPRKDELSKYPLARLLFELYIATFTGTLKLTRQGLTRIIYIDGGLPVHVESEQVTETIGRLLLEHGRITQAQYDQAQAIFEQEQLRFGEALVKIGAMGQGDLLDAMLEQTELKLSNSFAWRDGSFRLRGLATLPDNIVRSEVHPLKAIWRGVHENYDLPSLQAYLGRMRDRFAVATELFEIYFNTLGPFLRQLDIVSVLDGRRTFGAIITLTEGERGRQLAQALYVLLVTDLVRASAEPGKPASMPAGRPEPAAPTQAPTVDSAAVARIGEEIAEEYLRLKEGDFFDALRVEPASSPEEVEAAYENTSRPWRLEGLPQGLPEETLQRVREVNDLLLRARNVLRDPDARERYSAAQRDQYVASESLSVAPQESTAPPPPVTTGGLELDHDAHRRQGNVQAERAYSEGMQLLAGDNHSGAELKFKEAVKLSGQQPDYWVGLARAVRLQGGADNEVTRQRVVTSLQQAFQLDPSHVGANLEMARLLMAVGQGARGRSYLERVLQRSPENQEARRMLNEL